MNKMITTLALCLCYTLTYAQTININSVNMTTGGSGNTEIMGMIVAFKNNQLTLFTEAKTTFTVGQKGKISRYYKKKIGNTSMSYWLVLGKARVTQIKGQVIKFAISDKMKMTVNGKVKNFFEKGKEVKFIWGE